MKLNLHLHHLISIIQWANEKLMLGSPFPFSIEKINDAIESGGMVNLLLKEGELNGPVYAWARKKKYRDEVGAALTDRSHCGHFKVGENPLAFIISITVSAIDFHFDEVPPGIAKQTYKDAQELGLTPAAYKKARHEFEKKVQRMMAEKYDAGLP